MPDVVSALIMPLKKCPEAAGLMKGEQRRQTRLHQLRGSDANPFGVLLAMFHVHYQ